MKGRALRRSIETKDYVRIIGDLPLITDETILITPELAQDMLQKNKKNRPVNWKKVEEYSRLMSSGEWKLHSQGIILDQNGNILTGQKRLWAIIYADVPVYMRVSKGCPENTANLVDRGTPQSARDLATRKTDRKHSPIEASIARAICVLSGINGPTPDQIADIISKKEKILQTATKEAKGTRKTKGVLMMLGSICARFTDEKDVKRIIPHLEQFVDKLDKKLHPGDSNKCWGRGVAFTMAMQKANEVLDGYLK